jgi:hypothetical protein
MVAAFFPSAPAACGSSLATTSSASRPPIRQRAAGGSFLLDPRLDLMRRGAYRRRSKPVRHGGRAKRRKGLTAAPLLDPREYFSGIWMTDSRFGWSADTDQLLPCPGPVIETFLGLRARYRRARPDVHACAASLRRPIASCTPSLGRQARRPVVPANAALESRKLRHLRRGRAPDAEGSLLLAHQGNSWLRYRWFGQLRPPSALYCCPGQSLRVLHWQPSQRPWNHS